MLNRVRLLKSFLLIIDELFKLKIGKQYTKYRILTLDKKLRFMKRGICTKSLMEPIFMREYSWYPFIQNLPKPETGSIPTKVQKRS